MRKAMVRLPAPGMGSVAERKSSPPCCTATVFTLVPPVGSTMLATARHLGLRAFSLASTAKLASRRWVEAPPRAPSMPPAAGTVPATSTVKRVSSARAAATFAASWLPASGAAKAVAKGIERARRAARVGAKRGVLPGAHGHSGPLPERSTGPLGERLSLPRVVASAG
jgi:hypothetical protein